ALTATVTLIGPFGLRKATRKAEICRINGSTNLHTAVNVDAVILVDGGVDSLMRGDEAWAGTLVGDAISLAAIAKLSDRTKLLACLGFGTEVEEMVAHHHTLENIAALVQENAFLGACALIPQMEAFQFYENAVQYVWTQHDQQKGHIHSRIIPAVRGE